VEVVAWAEVWDLACNNQCLSNHKRHKHLERKKEELEQLSNMASRLEKEMGEVKKRIEELKKG